jgi:hypothetical protein
MTWEGIASVIAIIGLIITIIGNVAMLSFFAGKILAKIDSFTDLMVRFEKAYESHTLEDRNNRQAVWSRIDEHSKALATHEERLRTL